MCDAPPCIIPWKELLIRCNICNSLLVAPRYNQELKAWEPCDTCMEVIQDCLNDLKDNAVFIEEDELAVLDEAGIPLTIENNA